MRSRLAGAVCAVTIGVATTAAHAQPAPVPAPASAPAAAPAAAKTLAREAYARGATALEREDYVTAATEFLRADEASPSDVALKSAIDAAQRSQDPALAARVLNRSASRREELVAGPARKLQETFAAKLARVRLECQAAACSASIEGTKLANREPTWFAAGRHVASTTVEGGPLTDRVVDLAAGKVEVLALTSLAPPVSALPVDPVAPPPPSVEPTRGGVSPAFFWIGVGATAIVGGVATWSTIDLFSRRSDYENASCASTGSATCDSLASDGKSADTRTAVLWGVTGVLAVATAATGVFLVRWHDQRVGFGPAPGGGVVSVAGSWR